MEGLPGPGFEARIHQKFFATVSGVHGLGAKGLGFRALV